MGTLCNWVTRTSQARRNTYADSCAAGRQPVVIAECGLVRGSRPGRRNRGVHGNGTGSGTSLSQTIAQAFMKHGQERTALPGGWSRTFPGLAEPSTTESGWWTRCASKAGSPTQAPYSLSVVTPAPGRVSATIARPRWAKFVHAIEDRFRGGREGSHPIPETGLGQPAHHHEFRYSYKHSSFSVSYRLTPTGVVGSAVVRKLL